MATRAGAIPAHPRTPDPFTAGCETRMIQRLLDALLELRIARARGAMLRHDIARRTACAEFTRLIRRRSLAQVARMERARGPA